jgi:carboxyl-terminal processing protease
MLNSKSKYAILLLSSVLVAYAIIGGVLGRVSAQNGSYQQLSIFNEVLTRIRSDYVDEPTLKDAVIGAIRGLIESVDPYGGYLSPKDVAFYKNYTPYKTPGIGVILTRRAGYPMIVSAIPGGPAAKAGLAAGDFIESIEGLTAREMNLVQVHAMLANPAGKPVSLTIIRRRRAEPEKMSVNREVTTPPPVESRMLEGNIAYVKVPYLAPGKSLEARKALEALLKTGATSVLLDLRYTAGGEDDEAAELANIFLEAGTIGYLRGQKFETETFTANPKGVLTKAPLAVLINQATAGAAELVVGAIVDNQRGELIGAKTYGMGSFQRLIPLEDGWGLLISAAKYYTPSGKEIQAAGIKPTVEILQPGEEIADPSDEQLEPGKTPAVQDEDRQLLKAIEILKDPSKVKAAKAAA